YPLPEAQRDRFMARVSMGYPVETSELAMLNSRSGANPLDSLRPVTHAVEVARLVDIVNSVYVAEAVKQYAVALTTATRRSPDLRLGASPRATLHLVRAARAVAALDERDYVLPDDIQALVGPVLAHRLLPNTEAHLAGRSAERIMHDILQHVPMPQARGRSVTGE
ncbi:MAG: AAA family ATPase, partial [Nocardioidaceae bacterium]